MLRWGRLGTRGRVTFRVFLLVLLVAAVPGAAYFVLRWYAYDNWTVALRGNQVVVVQGQSGGVLWFNPKVVDHTGVTTAQILPPAVAAIGSGVQEPSLASADDVHNLVSQYDQQHAPPPSTTTSTTTTTTTAVGSTTTTAPPGAPAP